MKHLLLTALIALFIIPASAQITFDYLRSADDYFKKGDYYSAAVYYEKYLGGKTNSALYKPYNQQKGIKKTVPATNRQQAVYKLAESYRLLTYYVKAEPWYKEAASFDKGQFPQAKYWYGVTERTLGKYTEAETAFSEFINNSAPGDAYTAEAKKEIANLQFIRAQLQSADTGSYTITKAASNADTGAYYAPVFYDNSTLLITSTKPDKAIDKNKEHLNKIFKASYAQGAISNLDRMDIPQADGMHQGVLTITPDANTIFLTRWNINDNKKQAAIFSSTKTAGKWSEPKLVDALNAPGFNTQEPYVMPGGNYLLFSSDRPGGSGGFDLWYAPLDASGAPGTPVNLGEIINTSSNERAPFYHQSTGTLVFSSDGRIGMGGYDFYKSAGNIGKWSAPVNLGYPVNSVKDDIYFITNSASKHLLDEVIFSSDRSAACCLELFTMKKARALRTISGLVVACNTHTPLSGATVTIMDTVNNKTVATKITDASGRYSFSIEDYQPLKATAIADSFYAASLQFTGPQNTEDELFSNPDICLAAIEYEKAIVVENVYYEYDKYKLKPESYPGLDQLAKKLKDNPTLKVEISAHTDSKGTDQYNEKLSALRAKSVVDYLIKMGIDPSRLESKGYGATMPIAPNTNPDGSDNPEGRQKNRRTEFKVLKK